MNAVVTGRSALDAPLPAWRDPPRAAGSKPGRAERHRRGRPRSRSASGTDGGLRQDRAAVDRTMEALAQVLGGLHCLYNSGIGGQTQTDPTTGSMTWFRPT